MHSEVSQNVIRMSLQARIQFEFVAASIMTMSCSAACELLPGRSPLWSAAARCSFPSQQPAAENDGSRNQHEIASDDWKLCTSRKVALPRSGSVPQV
jgi:hypothetical protein